MPAFKRFARTVVRRVPVWAAYVGVVVLVALQVPWLDEPLKALGFRDTEEFRTVIVVLVISGLMLEIHDLSQRIAPTPGHRQHFINPDDMYHALVGRMRNASRISERRLDVLGLTLFSAWPTIYFNLQQREFTDWTIRMATISPKAVDAARWLPEDWLPESGENVKAVMKFAQDPGLQKRNIALEILLYDFVPGVHGFRLGNGDIYISNLLWQGDGLLGKPGFSYEFIPHGETGPSAEAYRELFNNWFTRAEAASAALTL